jgi:hypothetical protein
MAEILVRAIDGVCPNVAANPVRGNPVAVMPDGQVQGNAEWSSEYVVIKRPGVSVDLIKQYAARWETC